jgi:hypothetical protein
MLWRGRAARSARSSDGSADGDRPLLLKDLISKVQQELLQSRREREERGEPPMFEVADLTLEVHFVAQQTTEVNGGIDLKVLTVGGLTAGVKRGLQHQQIHKITLRLTGVPYADGEAWAALDTAPRFRPSED